MERGDGAPILYIVFGPDVINTVDDLHVNGFVIFLFFVIAIFFA